ncbi:MAG: threonine aldolase [Clostridiales bacterium GWF2_36_10]|nr:MAG: threonine aldolase [Clostridiales bacterium GWF2_36_10]HAN20614.1 low specificity L-threonine aldolase [Clostridiales bacterium]
MIRFESDYTEGTHPEIIKKLAETNLEQTIGYGEDEYCDNASKIIKHLCNNDVDIYFLVGGTQANTTIICSALRPYQGVISADTGHINVHETGAIEATGHKILSIPSLDGKIIASQIEVLCNIHFNDTGREHAVQPGMVYISNPTENGTIYKYSELKKINEVCKKYSLYLFLDGARLGYGLMASENDLTLENITELCDVFYIGGTKVGALFGEAVVIKNENIKKDFRYNIKQHGGMLAKGRLLGIQFETLFKDNLYFKISLHAIKLANMLREAFNKAGFDFLYNSPTNQLFPIIEDKILDKLSKKYTFSYWKRIDENHSAVRFCTSWATKETDVLALINDINKTIL